MQTNYNTTILHILMLLTLCVLAQILSQNTPRFAKTAHDYIVAAPEIPQSFRHNI
ncbi:MAG: hypothetical protein IKR92_04230 [Alphaproteobacteria bacterium]|nr:hypothetical protein [Alphaproteobacteria bacterium]